MTVRAKGRAIFYGRRSSDQQENSLESQVNWAIQAAANENISLAISRDLLDRVKASSQSHDGDLYLDDAISGSINQRAGLTACLQKALADRSVSHIFVHKRDRLARPDNPSEAASQEFKLSQAGITIVFSDARVEPTKDGQADIAQIITATIEYHRSGQFLQDLSKRILDVQKILAKQGFSTGGRAPYGFGRFLKSPNGELTSLPEGRRVKQTGHHVVHLPVDSEKIAVWISMLEMREQGLGLKRISNQLNQLGIPSPDAGRVRTDKGVRHRVSGTWNPNTVKELCQNPIIVGLLQHGTRSEGKHRRCTPDGSRPLNDEERNGDRVVTVINPVEERIRVEAAFAPQFSPERFEAIQNKVNVRSQSQRGVRRASDPSKYPLSTRVIDLTDGCGSIMYGVTHRTTKARKPIDTPYYTCGRYMKLQQCSHNRVDGERLLELVLRSIKHMVRRTGTRSELTQRLIDIASRKSPADPHQDQLRTLLANQATNLERERIEIGRKLSVESDPILSDIFRSEFTSKGQQLETIQAELCSLAQKKNTTSDSPETQVQSALELLDKLERLATVPEARTRLLEVLNQLGIWVGLDFREVKWGKRSVRKVRSGIISIGRGTLPINTHGRDNCDPNQPEGDCGCSAGPKIATTDRIETPGDGDAKSGENMAQVTREGDSLTMVNRGDRI